jgi:hypothetical protein
MNSRIAREFSTGMMSILDKLFSSSREHKTKHPDLPQNFSQGKSGMTEMFQLSRR